MVKKLVVVVGWKVSHQSPVTTTRETEVVKLRKEGKEYIQSSLCLSLSLSMHSLTFYDILLSIFSLRGAIIYPPNLPGFRLIGATGVPAADCDCCDCCCWMALPLSSPSVFCFFGSSCCCWVPSAAEEDVCLTAKGATWRPTMVFAWLPGGSHHRRQLHQLRRTIWRGKIENGEKGYHIKSVKEAQPISC